MSVVSPVFHRMLAASQIEDQAKASLKLWFPTYLREVERQLDLSVRSLPEPTNYSERNSFDMEAPEDLPKIVVIAPGLAAAPSKRGSWTYNATWRLGVGIAVGAETEDAANDLVKAYGAAIRGIMLQNHGMSNIGGLDIAWTDETYDDLPVANLNQLVKGASLWFNVEIGDVATRGHGPTVPNESSYEYGEAETVDVTITKVEEVTQ
jgi:hypothetical protein